MRSLLLLPLLGLLSACSFPVDEFVVEGQSASDGGRDAAETAPEVALDTSPPCTCIEVDKDHCKKWSPDKCGEIPK